MSLYQASIQLGATIGPVLGGYLAWLFDFRAPFWAYMLVGLAAAATAAFAFTDTLDPEERRKPLPSSVRRIGLMTPAFTVVCVLSFAIFFTRVVTLFQLVPLIGADTFKLDVGTIGAALTLCAFTNFLGMPITAPMLERLGARATVAITTIANALCIGMLWFDASVWVFWLSVGLLGVTMGVSYPSISAYIIGCLPRERYGPGMGMQRTFGDVGFVIGPVIAGFLYDIAGPGHTVVILMNVGLLAVCTVLFVAGSGGARRETA
jgi:MFS family permease